MSAATGAVLDDIPVAGDPIGARGALLRKNSLASAIRAASTSLTTVLLPIVLVLALPQTMYSIWALMFSIAAFTLYFDLGTQASVLALVGRADAAGDHAGALAAGRAGIRVAAMVASIATGAGVVVGLLLHPLFPSIPAPEVLPAAAALVLLFVGQGLGLIGTALASYFAGRQRTASATAVLAPARFASLGLTCIAAFAGAGLVVLAVCFVIPVACGVAVLGFRFVREGRGHRIGRRHVGVRGLLRFSGTLILWNVCMLVVSGIDLTIVGRLDFEHVALYSVASTVAVGIAGLDNALIAPVLPELSGRHGQGDAGRVTALLSSATRSNAIGLGGAFVAVAAASPVVALILFRGADLGLATGILVVLTAANALRLTLAPLSLGFIARGTHTKLIVQPILETLANLVASIALGILLGAIGVAIGTVIGAAVGVVVAVTWSMHVSGRGLISRRDLVRQAFLRPVLAWSPAVLILALIWVSGLWGSALGTSVGLIGATVTAPLALVCLGADGRAPLRRLLPSRLRTA